MALGGLACEAGEEASPGGGGADAGMEDGGGDDAAGNNGAGGNNGETGNNGVFSCAWAELHKVGPGPTLTPVTIVGRWEQRLEALADIDGDGTYEFVTRTHYGSWQVTTEDGRRVAPAPGAEYYLSLTACDLDADGMDDLVATTAGTIVALRSRGDGTFDERRLGVAADGDLSIGCGDVNNDGVMDVVFGTGSALVAPDTGERGHVGVLLGQGGLEFVRGPFSAEPEEQAHPRRIIALHLTDVDGDGILDVVSAGPRGGVSPGWDAVVVQRGLGDGRFSWSQVGPVPGLNAALWADVSADLNDDGRMDLIACTDAGCATALSGEDGSFRDATWLAGLDAQPPAAFPPRPRLVAVDLNADGLMDVAGSDGGPESSWVGYWRGTGDGFESPTKLLDQWGTHATALADRSREQLWISTVHDGACEPECEADGDCPNGVCTLGSCSLCYTADDCAQGTCTRGGCLECDASSDCPDDATCRGARCVRTVSSEAGWQDVSIGAGTGCGLRESGEVRCWGLAAPAPSGRFVKVEVNPGAGRTACAIGEDHHLSCWGPAWLIDEAPLAEVLDIVLQDSFACALDLEGEAQCWPTHTLAEPEGVTIAPPPAGPFSQLTASEGTVCGLRTDGGISCWSCDPTAMERCFGRVIGVVPGGPFVSISAGNGLGCALRADGTAACWGENTVAPRRDGRYLDLDARQGNALFVTTTGDIEQYNGGPYSDESRQHDAWQWPDAPYVRVSSGEGAVCTVREDGRIQCVGSELSVP